ncbi:MAG TPA: M56 family metallopeptidase [Bryobacteraceae bacterium]|jgi:TonB family protein|nr:M56 family metallopeptidase [Bryobacteraceae bacterium]
MHSTIASLFLRSAVILAAAELLRRFPRQTASYRHRLLIFAFVCLAMWPLLAGLVPELQIPVWPQWNMGYRVTVEQTNFRLASAGPARPPLNWPLILWLSGVCLAFAPTLIGYRNVLRLTRGAKRVIDPVWTDLLENLCRENHVAPVPELLMASAPVMPLTFGLRRRRILIPSNCGDWTALRRRAVLLHELGHLQRRDLASQFFANIVAALWWFQPLVWMARWNLRRESERACDALVLESGLRASDYAAELLAIAHGFRQGQVWTSPAIAMARRCELEGRLTAILDPQPQRAVRTSVVVSLVLLAATAVAASAVTILSPSDVQTSGGSHMKRTLLSGLLASAGLSAATIAGSLFDPGGAAIPNATAVIINPDTSARQETSTTTDGTFSFESVPAGQYILRIDKPGFATLYREFNVQADSDVKRGLVLPLAPAQNQMNQQVDAGARAATSQPANPKDIRISPKVAEANLIQKVQPVYPTSAKQAHIQGQVDLQLVISTEGVPVDISVVSSPSDDLTQSALDAVGQWRYRPTLLNGAPIEVVTDVMINYTLSN